MPPEKENKNTKIEVKLDSITLLLKDLLALKLREKGRTRDEIREILKMDTNRVSLLIKEIKKKNSKKKQRK